MELVFIPSPVRVWPGGQALLGIPESASLQVNLTVTSPLYQPAAFGLVVAAALIVGVVVSMLMPLCVLLALLPALSVQMPVALWFAPSPLRVCAALALTTPEVA